MGQMAVVLFHALCRGRGGRAAALAEQSGRHKCLQALCDKGFVPEPAGKVNLLFRRAVQAHSLPKQALQSISPCAGVEVPQACAGTVPNASPPLLRVQSLAQYAMQASSMLSLPPAPASYLACRLSSLEGQYQLRRSQQLG
jgi:hypothetical protein